MSWQLHCCTAAALGRHPPKMDTLMSSTYNNPSQLRTQELQNMQNIFAVEVGSNNHINASKISRFTIWTQYRKLHNTREIFNQIFLINDDISDSLFSLLNVNRCKSYILYCMKPRVMQAACQRLHLKLKFATEKLQTTIILLCACPQPQPR